MGENLEAKGDDYEERAEKKLKSWGILGSKYEDAADLLEKAGNSYKLAKTCVILNPLLLCNHIQIYTIDDNIVHINICHDLMTPKERYVWIYIALQMIINN